MTPTITITVTLNLTLTLTITLTLTLTDPDPHPDAGRIQMELRQSQVLGSIKKTLCVKRTTPMLWGIMDYTVLYLITQPRYYGLYGIIPNNSTQVLWGIMDYTVLYLITQPRYYRQGR